MNIRFIEAFHWAVVLKSVTRAAQRLHITQSTLSARIVSLEEELGTVLIDRKEKAFQLTSAGQRFYTLALKVLEAHRQLLLEMGSNTDQTMTLRIGAIESVAHSWLTEWLKTLKTKHPNFQLELTVDSSPVLTDQIKRGAQDLVFTALAVQDGDIKNTKLPPMPMAFVGHTNIHRKRRYTLSTLAEYELLTFQRGSYPHQMLLSLFQQQNMPMPRIHTLSSISAIAQLVGNGFGIATLPHIVAQSLHKAFPLRILPAPENLPALPMYANLREDPSSDLAQRVLQSAIKHLHRQ